MTEPGASFTSIDPDADTFQLLRRELGVTSFGINLLTLRPGQRLRVHSHERQEEVYLVLEGELTLIVEAEPHVLGRGDGEHRGRDGEAWVDWDDEGEGRPPKEIPLPDDLPVQGLRENRS